MKKYRVRFYKNVTTCDRHSIEVEASSSDEARARVLEWGNLTDDELLTEELEREGDVVDSEFSDLAFPDDPYAVVEVDPAPLPKWDVFAARDGDTYRAVIEAEDEEQAKEIARPRIAAEFCVSFSKDDPGFFDAELDGFLVEEKR